MLSCTARPIADTIIRRPKSCIYDYAACDSILATASAEVMFYNDALKRWDPPTNGNDGLSVVQIVKSGTTMSFRIIAYSNMNKAIVLNCNIHHKLKYHTATPTFHQWRDEQRQVYGLNFSSPEEARQFVCNMSDCIGFLNNVHTNGSNEYQQIHHDNVYQDPQQHMPHNQSAPTFREQDDSLHPNFRKSSHSVQGSQQLTQQQRRSSQSSSSSSNAGLSGMMGQMSVAAPRAPASNIPPAPAPPPISGAPPAPPPPPANIASVNPQAPPPPPPPPANLSAVKPMSSITADALKNKANQLNKTNGPGGNGSAAAAPAPPPAAPPKLDFVQELAATFNQRKAKQAQADATDNKSNTSNGSSDSGVYPPVKPKVNGNAASPKTHRKAPSASSISSQEENITKAVNGAINGLSHGPVTAETLEKFRAELMVEVRLEINKAKQDIIEAIRAEMRR